MIITVDSKNGFRFHIPSEKILYVLESSGNSGVLLQVGCFINTTDEDAILIKDLLVEESLSKK